MNGGRALVYFACLALCFGLAQPGQSFFSSSHGPKITVLWIPSEKFKNWSELDDLLEHYKDLRLTVAVAPEDVPPDAAKKLAGWNAAGRIELALRLKGDPILPRVLEDPQAPRPQDALDRLALEREPFKALFGVPPAGFSPGAGAVSNAMLPAFGAMGLSWAACADYTAGIDAWAAAGPTVLVPLKAARSTGALKPEDLSLPEYPRSDAFVVDEADGLVPDGAWLKLLRALSEKHPRQGWATLSEAAAERRSAGLAAAPTLASWPTWTGGSAPWTASPASRKAWGMYEETAKTLAQYQNSGAAELKDLDEATAELYLAQAANLYRLIADTKQPAAAEADRELRAHLTAVYRKMKQTPPETLFSPLSETEDAAPGSTDVHFSRGDSWLAFENPPGSLGREPWKIRGLRVEWSEKGVSLIYKMSKLEAAPGSPGALGDLMLDIYIDLNHTAGAGSVKLLPGRRGVMAARDAWEYAVTVSAWGAYLYRSSQAGPPVAAGKLVMSVDAQANEITVAVPSSLIKGNPARWGYAVLAMAVDPSTAATPPPQPLTDAKGGTTLGILAPQEAQRGIAADSSKPRLTALRARGDLL